MICPRCGSSRIWKDYPRFGCNECGFSWDIDDDVPMIQDREDEEDDDSE